MWLSDRFTMRDVARVEERAHELKEDRLIEARSRIEARREQGYQVSNGEAVIDVSGVLLAQDNELYEAFGVPHTSYEAINRQLVAAKDDPAVESLTLAVSSGGGQVAGLFETMANLRDFGKPTRTVAESAASAAYALASATASIEAVHEGASFGSVGVVADYPVPEGVVSITSSNAPHKRPDVTTSEGQAVLREHLDEVEALFINNIADGRAVSPDTVRAQYGQGRMFLAQTALDSGLIDSIRGSNTGLMGISQEAAPTATRSTTRMNIETLKAEHPEVFRAAVELGAKTERERVCAHLKLGESAKAVETAISAIRDGRELTQDMQAEYMAAAMSARDTAHRTDDSAQAQSTLAAAAPQEPVAEGEAEADAFAAAFKAGLSKARGQEV